VASTTLTGPLEWENSTLLEGDVPQAVAELKQQDGADLLVIGSSELVRTLVRHGVLRPLRLIELQPTTTGAVLATYGMASV